MNYRDTIGHSITAIPAMTVEPSTAHAIIDLCKAILERLGATPADPDDSLHTIVGQRDATQAAGILKGTDTLIALLKQLVTQQGLIYFGDITTAANTVTFASTNLISYENDFFNNWYAYIVRDDAGASAAPQNEYRLITDYVSASGTFTINAFSAAHVVGDQVMIIHPMLYEILTIRGGAYTIQDIMDEHAAELDLAEYATNSVTCDGTEQTLWSQTSNSFPIFCAGGWIDFTGANSGAGEDTTIKLQIAVDGTNYRTIYEETFLQAAVPSPAAIPFPRSSNTQVVPDTFYIKQNAKITIQQVAVGGGYNTLGYRIIDAERGS